ncbi:serine/threonine-protein kinase [Hyalangium gracile]|uniref:serine/threonine-protein kinase n=1 Tax=Hyalangium gracile TaxID=394092 RepID=UPI001CCEF3F3|nr:serine/threonine-protein kinase [Hyalangium gracile]
MISPGDHAGLYVVVRRAAVGATSHVYEGRHAESGEQVAIKVLSPELCIHAEVVARFINEAQDLQRLRHPHLVAVLTSGVLPQGAPFMVLEWLPANLHEVLTEAGRRLPPEACVEIIRQLAGALAVLHAHEIIHRDLKPANVLLARREAEARIVKLADLGLAKRGKGEGALTPALPVSTAGSALLGTREYIAPEQWVRSKSVGPAADVYSLGVLWFEMLTGRVPFSDDAQQDLMYQHLFLKPPLALLEDVAPEPVRDLVARMLEKEAEKRLTLGELLQQL